MVNLSKAECSISTWYPVFVKDSLDTEILPIPEDVLKYLESDPFILPVEATDNKISHLKWVDGSSVNDDSQDDSEVQPTFLEFSKKVQDVIDDFGAVFIKSNWRTPSDAIWVTATKTLKCTSLEDIYLLLKSSNQIACDITVAKELSDDTKIQPCLALKRWRDINPSTEFRCFVINKELVGICQRDVSQYHQYIENEKYNIQNDITSLFRERIKDRFKLNNYSFDVIRYKKDKVKIIDFGLLNESASKGTLFTYSELHNTITNPPEFRFIAEDIGIQPNTSNHFIVPREINEFFSSNDPDSMIDMIRRAIENQQIEEIDPDKE